MEKRIFRIEIALVALIVLVSVNLIMNINNQQKLSNGNNAIVENDLPENFNDEYQKDLLSKIKKYYNEENYHEFYFLFGKSARLQFDESKIETNLNKLRPLTGKILDYAYDNSEYLGEEANASFYRIIYRSKFENGNGKITVNIREVRNDIEVVGIFINLENI